MWLKRGGAVAVVVAATMSSACGDLVRESQSPSQLVVTSMLTVAGTSGSVPTSGFTSGPLLSDVPALGQTVFNDFGQATLRVILKDPGRPGSPTAPSSLNDVTISRYTVTYKRFGGPEGQSVPGVDVPRPIDGALTLTIPVGGTASGVVELVRHVAKLEAPLAALGSSPVVMTMIAEVTFYGRDQAGNALSATADVQINFANYN